MVVNEDIIPFSSHHRNCDSSSIKAFLKLLQVFYHK